MSSSDSSIDSSARLRRSLGTIVVLAGVLLLVFAIYHYFTRPPQMGSSDEAFATVDALFTAVTARDEKRLNDCERRLKRLAEAGELPPAAGKSLDSIIGKARAGKWQSSAESLYDFMLAQRREESPGRSASATHKARK